MTSLSAVMEEEDFGAPDDEAAEWFVRRREGLGVRAEGEFTAWLERDPANRTAYEQVCRGWALTGEAAAHPAVCEMRSEALMIRPPRRSRLPALAAGLATMLALGGGYTVLEQSPRSQAPQVAQVSEKVRLLQTAIGERSSVTLDDGSVVILNTNSKVKVAYSQARRDVVLLAGQAIFSVAKNKARPFVVTAGDREVTAVGTEFEVRLQHKKVSVALLEGVVDVRRIAPQRVAEPQPVEPPMRLEAGEKLTAIAGQPASVKSANVEEQTSWRVGRVRFDDMPLGHAVSEMNRYSQRPIIILDQRLSGIRVSGAFKTGQIGSFVAAISDLFAIEAEDTGEEIILRAQS